MGNYSLMITPNIASTTGQLPVTQFLLLNPINFSSHTVYFIGIILQLVPKSQQISTNPKTVKKKKKRRDYGKKQS